MVIKPSERVQVLVSEVFIVSDITSKSVLGCLHLIFALLREKQSLYF